VPEPEGPATFVFFDKLLTGIPETPFTVTGLLNILVGLGAPPEPDIFGDKIPAPNAFLDPDNGDTTLPSPRLGIPPWTFGLFVIGPSNDAFFCCPMAEV
jgi:hypothetical protein